MTDTTVEYKVDPRAEKKNQIVEYLRRFPFYKWAAKSVAIDEDTLLIWRKEDEEFSDRVEVARSEGIRYFGGRATPDLILKSADPKTFKDQSEVNLNVFNNLTDEQLDQLIKSKLGKVGIVKDTSGEGATNETPAIEVRNPTSETA